MTELCIQNLSAVLKEAGSSLEKVVKVNVFLTTMDHFAEMNGVYEKFFKHKPARSEFLSFWLIWVGVAEIMRTGDWDLEEELENQEGC